MNKFWKFLDNKKTILSAVYWVVAMNVLPVVGASEQTEMVVKVIGDVLTAIGLGHKGVKSFIATK